MKIIYLFPTIIVILFLIGVVVSMTVLYSKTIILDNFCKEKNYEYFTISDIEDGYVKCYNKNYINHEFYNYDYEIYKIGKKNE